MPVTVSVSIREVVPADEPALAALEWSAPDAGALQLRLRLRTGYLALTNRYPNVRGFVAVDGSDSVVGAIFSSTAPTRCGDRMVSGVYLFSLRVHPAARRLGLGTTLVQHAWEEARRRDGAEIGWAGVLEGNVASARTLARAGFDWYRDLAVRTIPRLICGMGTRGRVTGGLVVRRGRDGDLDELAAALEAAHLRHQLWRPLDADILRQELVAAGQSLDDLWLALDRAGTIRSAGAAFDVGRVADVRVGGVPGLARAIRPVLAPALARLPIRPLLFTHALLDAATPQLIRRLLRAYQGITTTLSIVIDPRDPAWPIVRSLPGLTGHVSVVVRGLATLDRAAPLAPL